MNKNTGILFVLLLTSILLLQGCTASQEELTKDMVSKMPGYYNLYVIADDLEQVEEYKGNIENVLSDKSRKILYYRDVIWAFDEGKRNYTKAFGIKEYPMYLVFDEESLVLKTTSIEEVDDFLNNKENLWGREVEPDSILVQPAYHLAIFRSEFAHLYYETDERIGFQIADGIFLYNYKEDRMEAAFALREGSFEPNYFIVPTMSADEKSIIINGFDISESTMSTYFYQYDIASGEISRMEGSVTDVAKYPHPSEDRWSEALKSETWMFEDIRYYPEGSSTFYTPFKKSDIPTVTYELKNTDLNTPIAPYLTLSLDGRFVFRYSSLSSYLNYGEYEIKGTEYIMLTKDGNYTFRFHKLGENLVFDSEGSAKCRLDDGTELPNGAEFALRK